MPLLVLAVLAASQVPYQSPLVGVWNQPAALASVWALRVTWRGPEGVADAFPVARRTLPRYKVRVLTDVEAGTQSYKGNKLVFDGFRADTLDLAVVPVPGSEEGLILCSVAVSRNASYQGAPRHFEFPLLLYQTIGYAHGGKNVEAEMRRQLVELGKAFVEGRKWATEDAAKHPPKRP